MFLRKCVSLCKKVGWLLYYDYTNKKMLANLNIFKKVLEIQEDLVELLPLRVLLVS